MIESRQSALYQRITARITIYSFDTSEVMTLYNRYQIKDPSELLSLHTIFGGRSYPYSQAGFISTVKGSVNISILLKQASELQDKDRTTDFLEVQLGKNCANC
jgi:hypothetical protein